MTEDKAVFASTILVERSPNDASNIFLSRLLEGKALNNQVGSFMFEYMLINKHYSNRLKKILDTKGKNLNQSIDQYIKKETRHDSKYQDASMLNNDHLGSFGDVWDSLMEDIKQEIEINETFCRNIEKQLISKLKKCFDIEKNEKYSRMLNSILELNKVAESDNAEEWAIKSPQVCENFEVFEDNRLLFLKDMFFALQSNLNYKFNENLKHNEVFFGNLANFNPESEIARFAKQCTSATNGSSAASAVPVQPPKPRKSNVIKPKDASTPPIIDTPSSRKTSSKFDNELPMPPVVPSRSTPSTINSQATEKRRNGLRSKVGTLFGRKKKEKKRGNSISGGLDEESPIAEAEAPANGKSASANASSATKTARESYHAPPSPPAPRETGSGNGVAAGAAAVVAAGATAAAVVGSGSAGSDSATEKNGTSAPVSVNQAPLVPKHADKNGSTASLGDSVPPLPSQSQPPAPVKKDRHDIQSKLFQNLTTAAIMEQGRNSSQDRLSYFGGAPPLPKHASFSVSEASRKQSSISDIASMDNASQLSVNRTGASITTSGATSKFLHPELNKNGLNASISESIKVSMRDGYLEQCQVIGEIALTYLKPPLGQVPAYSFLKLVDTSNSIEKLIPNHSFVENVGEKVFKVNPSQISSRTLGGLKYLVSNSESPVIIFPVWRFEPQQASCMITIRLSDTVVSKLPPSSTVELDNLLISIALEEGVEISNAMSRPSGTYNKEKRRITWKYEEPVKLSNMAPETKIVARFMTNGLAKESKKGCQARFAIHNGRGAEYVVSGVKLQCSEVSGLEAQNGHSMENAVWNNVAVVKTFNTNVFTAHSLA